MVSSLPPRVWERTVRAVQEVPSILWTQEFIQREANDRNHFRNTRGVIGYQDPVTPDSRLPSGNDPAVDGRERPASVPYLRIGGDRRRLRPLITRGRRQAA
jgi:hypothetical protein